MKGLLTRVQEHLASLSPMAAHRTTVSLLHEVFEESCALIPFARRLAAKELKELDGKYADDAFGEKAKLKMFIRQCDFVVDGGACDEFYK